MTYDIVMLIKHASAVGFEIELIGHYTSVQFVIHTVQYNLQSISWSTRNNFCFSCLYIYLLEICVEYNDITNHITYNMFVNNHILYKSIHGLIYSKASFIKIHINKSDEHTLKHFLTLFSQYIYQYIFTCFKIPCVLLTWKLCHPNKNSIFYIYTCVFSIDVDIYIYDLLPLQTRNNIWIYAHSNIPGVPTKMTCVWKAVFLDMLVAYL